MEQIRLLELSAEQIKELTNDWLDKHVMPFLDTVSGFKYFDFSDDKVAYRVVLEKGIIPLKDWVARFGKKQEVIENEKAKKSKTNR